MSETNIHLTTELPINNMVEEGSSFILPGDKELQEKIENLTQRIEKGKAMVKEYRDKHGADNFKYIQHYQKLKKELEQTKQQIHLLENRQVSFQNGVYKKAITAFRELVDLNLRKEYDTPRYKEQEDLIRKYIRENDEIFSIFFHLQTKE